MLEKDLNKKIRDKLAKNPETACFRVHGGPHGVRGLPDIVGCSQGFFFAFEVKLPGKKNTLTMIQAKKLRDLEEAGGIVAVVTTVLEARKALRAGIQAKKTT
jgi:Holliday junction resolvase